MSSFSLVATGDNSGNKLLRDLVSGSATFHECKISAFDPSDIVELAGASFLAVLLRTGAIFTIGTRTGSPARFFFHIALTSSTVYGLDHAGILRILGSVDLPFGATKLTSFAASSRFVAGVTLSGDCIVGSATIARGCIAVGCTSSYVFALTDFAVVRFDGAESTTIPTRMIAIGCSEDEAFFIDESGGLFQCCEASFRPVRGLPPVVQICPGTQHTAAVAADGRLFVWGFNPSGQLGVGTDRSIADPKCVLTRVQLVACGTHNTWAVVGPGLPRRPPGFRGTPGDAPTAAELPFSERLLV